MNIQGVPIGPEHKPFVIAELSGNHGGSLERALVMLESAAATGCHAVKLQSYTPDSLTILCDRPDFVIKGGLWDGRTLYDLYEEAHTPFEWHAPLFARAKELGVILLSTPFDESAVDLLESLDCPAYKVASFEIVDLELIARIAKCGKPMIISTGLASLADIEAAVFTARGNGCQELALLHCISSYPAPSDQSNLRTIPHLSAAFNVVGGLSDHTLGTATSVAAIALGASIIEKHFTLDRSAGGPDADFSLEPSEFSSLVSDCLDAFKSLGRVGYEVKQAESANRVFRRSLYVIRDVKAGDEFTRDNVRAIRPGYGMSPAALPNVLGRTAARDIVRGEPLAEELLR